MTNLLWTTPREAAINGASWLDTVQPAWWQRIDTDTLDIASDIDCVLGQVFSRTYTVAADALALDHEARVGLGFTVPKWQSWYREIPKLNAAWREEIDRRRVAEGGDVQSEYVSLPVAA